MKIKKFFKVTAIIFMCCLVVTLALVFVQISKSINEVKNIDVNLHSTTSSVCEIYNNQGQKINKNTNNSYVKLENISPYLIKAFVSIEDKKFYKHNGLNYLRIAKAMLNNIIARDFVEGASTISQQLIKNKYLTNEKSIDRKIKEMYLTLKLEANEEKDKIIESYINTIYYGNGAYGISNASHRFFNKTPDELNLAECALLAGIVKSPAKYSPINNFENSIKRKNLVLKEMHEDKIISEDEYFKAINEDIKLNMQNIANYDNLDIYSKKAICEASEILNISKYEILNKGYKIYTYQDSEQQKILDEIVNDDKYYQKNEYGNIADNLTLIMDNETIGITAVSGRSKYDLTSFKRQPGSLIKPILVYTPAYEEKIIYPSSLILDEKITINNYSPHNVSNEYFGYISVRDSVAKSLNIPAVKLCNELGIEKCKNYAKNAGIKFDEKDNGLAIALGGFTEGVSLEEITNAYTPLYNNGLYKKYSYIKEIKSPHNLTLYTNNKSETRYCSQESAYLMTENPQYATKKGTSKKLQNIAFDIAGKTGTVNVKNSNLNTDAYSLAYTSKHTISTWLGNYTMDKEFNLNGNNNGGTFATEIVRSIVEKIYTKNPPDNFKIPDTIITLPIDTIALEKNNEIVLGFDSPIRYQKYEIFSSNNIPNKYSNQYSSIPNININVIQDKSGIKISFDTLEYFDYYLYKIHNGKSILIKKISNKNEEITYYDNDIIFNKEYGYYVDVKSPYNNSKFTSKTKYITILKNYDSLLNNLNHNNNHNWIFN